MKKANVALYDDLTLCS